MEEDDKNPSMLPRESVVRYRKEDEEEITIEEEQWETEGGSVTEQSTTDEVVSEFVPEPDTTEVVSEPIADPVTAEVVSEPDEEPVTEEVVSEPVDEPVVEEAQPEKIKDEWFDEGELVASVTFTPEPEMVEEAPVLPTEGWTVSNTVNTVIQSTTEPETVKTVILKDDNETFNAYYKKFVYLAGIAVILIMLGVIFTRAFSDYEIKPNYAPETAREDVSPGELIRRQLDPRTHFPRQPEVIRKERREREWNNMSYWQRFKYYLFGDENER